jgi:pimeloyl-ACP methyl ester carboxylesterase
MKLRCLSSLLLIVPLQCQAQALPGEQFSQTGGHHLAWECKGSGDKTVLLIAGMGLDAPATYKSTFKNFSADGYRICLYDRAGTGHSSALTAPRPLSALADELDGLVRERGWHDLVLVAHSFGGLVARAYAQAHPQAVKGIVFVDCVHESWYPAMKASLSPDGWHLMETIMNWERDTHSHEDFAEAVQAMAAYKAKLTMPVTVLSRGLPYTAIRKTKMSYDDVDAYNSTWDMSQFELAHITSDARHVRMRYSDHLFDEHDPWLVIDEIKLLLKRVDARVKPN